MPPLEKSAGVTIELKDLDSNKRTAVIKHAVYTSIDRVKDISTKGMFTKSWNEGLPKFYFNHDSTQKPGVVKSVSDDNEGAYTEVKFANTTLGNDVMEMASEGMLEGASYGYVTEKKQFIEVKGQKVRKLLEVKHLETSLLDVTPCHPEAGIVILNKSLNELELKALSETEQTALKTVLANDMASIQSLITLAGSLDTNSDLYGYIMYMVSRRADTTSSIMDQLKWNAQQMANVKAYVEKVDDFCRNTKASDETIIRLQEQALEYKNIISQYDTAFTLDAKEPGASDDEVKAMLMRMQIALTI